jgi:type I restriction enzyme S subunit
LQDICDLKWGDTSITKASYVSDGYPAFSASGCDGLLPHFDYEGPGIVVSAIGARCGKTWLADGRWSCIKNTIVIRPKSDEVDVRFIFFATLDPSLWPRRGAAQPFIALTDAKNIVIDLPPLATQRQIAALLSAYDELIQNDLRRIRSLEEMASALYREWFVDFRIPGYEAVPRSATLLGPLPRGWELRRMPTCIEINPHVTIADDQENAFVPMDGLTVESMVITKIETRVGRGGARFQNGDTLFPRITPSLENGKTGFVQFLPDSEAVATGSTEFIVFRSRSLTPEFVYLLARSERLRATAIKSMSGASGRQRVREECFDDLLLAQPPRALLDRFSVLVAPSFRLSQVLHLQALNLRRTRDLLLPRLLSGQLNVDEAA